VRFGTGRPVSAVKHVGSAKESYPRRRHRHSDVRRLPRIFAPLSCSGDRRLFLRQGHIPGRTPSGTGKAGDNISAQGLQDASDKGGGDTGEVDPHISPVQRGNADHRLYRRSGFNQDYPQTPGPLACRIKADTQSPCPTRRIHHRRFLSTTHER